MSELRQSPKDWVVKVLSNPITPIAGLSAAVRNRDDLDQIRCFFTIHNEIGKTEQTKFAAVAFQNGPSSRCLRNGSDGLLDLI